jgi:hypothetical protein
MLAGDGHLLEASLKQINFGSLQRPAQPRSQQPQELYQVQDAIPQSFWPRLMAPRPGGLLAPTHNSWHR